MKRNGLVLRVVSVAVSFVFLWTNCGWAEVLPSYKLAAQSHLAEVLKSAEIVYTGTALHSNLLEYEVRELKILYQNQKKIREKLRESIGDRVDELKTLIFQGEGGVAYYTFTPDGYFYRFITVPLVDDPFYRLIERFILYRSKKVDVPVKGYTYYQEIIQIPPQIVELINTCLGELYPEGVMSSEEYLQIIEPDTIEIIGRKERNLVHRDGDWHRVVHVIITTRDGKSTLVQIRNDERRDLSVGGHVDIGEDMDSAALREIKEELRIEPNKVRLKRIGNGYYKKIGRKDFKGSEGYKDDGIFYSRSKEIYNREISALYVYRLSEDEEKILKGKVETKEVIGAEFISINSAIEEAIENPDVYASTFKQYFTNEEVVSLVNACPEELYPEGLRRISPNNRFKIGYEPVVEVPDNIAVKTSSLTAVVLTKLGLRGAGLGLDKKKDKAKISEIKDRADGIAKRIYERIIKSAGVILRIRVSEGFGRDEVAESFKANEVVNPEGRAGIEDAIVDVIEGTNAFVYDVAGKRLEELSSWESGATSIIVTGPGVESLGNCPDIYTDGIFTTVPKGKRQEFVDNPLDPELTAKEPSSIEGVLIRIADANGISINDLEVVLMDRTREAERLEVLRGLQQRYPSLDIVIIKDGTVAHSLLATFGRREGKHKVVMTVGGAPEGFLNLAVTGIFCEEGAVAGIRIYSKNVNKTLEGTDAQDLSRRYDFSSKERGELERLRPDDFEDIINGKKLFIQEDVRGEVEGSFSFITNNGVFGIEGVRELKDGSYLVEVLRVGRINGKPCAWFEKKIFKPEELQFMLEGEEYRGDSKGSHLVRVAPEGEEVPFMSDEEFEPYKERFSFAMNRLRHIYGPGIFTLIRETRIVENLNVKGLYPEGKAPLAGYNPSDGLLKIDKKLFGYGKWVLFEELEHEYLESIGDIIPGCSRTMSDVVSTYINVLRFLDPNMGVTEDRYKVDVEEYRNEILEALKGEELDPDEEYIALLKGLLKLERKGALNNDLVVASVVGYVMRTKICEDVRDELGLPQELAIIIKIFYPLFEDALRVFGEIKEAKQGKGLVEKVKETEGLTFSVIKTFTGVRIQGLDKIDKRLAEVTAVLVKIASKMEMIASLPLAMTEGRYYIVVDRNRITKEMEDAIRKLEENKVFKVVYEVPIGYDPKKIIRLVDPADLREGMREGILYLPMTYLRSSLYMAAHVVSAGGEAARIDPLVKGLIIDLYKITDEELIDLFNTPWKLLPKIQSVISELNKLRDALAEIEKAA